MLKKVLVISLMFLLVLTSFGSLSTYAETVKILPLSIGKTATAKNPVGTATDLTDGITEGSCFGSYAGDSTTTNDQNAQWVMIDMASSYNITQVDMYPSEVTSLGSEFPQKFRIDISNDAGFGSFETVYETTDDYYTAGSNPEGVQSFEIEGKGRYVRVYATKTGDRYDEEGGTHYYGINFSEIMVYADTYSRENIVSLGKTASGASSGSSSFLTDGSLSTGVGYFGGGDTNWASPTKYLSSFNIDLGSIYSISCVKLYPAVVSYGSRFPKRFRIDISDSESFETYTTIYDASTNPYYDDPNVPGTADTKVRTGPTDVQSFDVNGIGRYIRLQIIENATSYVSATASQGNYRTGFNEIEVYSGDDYELVNIYKDGNGNDITSENAMPSSGSVSVITTVKNNSGFEDEGILIYALYNNGYLDDILVIPSVFGDEKVMDMKTFGISADPGNNYELKVFLWDGMDLFKPLGNNTTFPQ